MKIILTSVLLLSWQPIIYAGEAVLSGQAYVLSEPDYVELYITVESKCYPTVIEATQINDESAKNIVDFLNTKLDKKDEYNKVVTNGGYTLPYQTYYQDKFFCQDTFQKTNNIIFRTQKLKGFEKLFNEIQNVVYKQLSHKMPSVVESAISYATISAPNPGISTPKRTELEQKAIRLAFNDAKGKLQSLFDDKKLTNFKLTHVSEFPPNEPRPHPMARAAPMELMSAKGGNGGGDAPVEFDQQAINKTMYFTFTFDDLGLMQ